MKIFSLPSILLLCLAFGAGAGTIAASLTFGSLWDYNAVISAPETISLSGERLRLKPDDYEQAVQIVREKTAPAAVEIFFAPSDASGIYEPGEGQASGFFITSDGWLVTAPRSFSASEAALAKVLVNGKIYATQKVVEDPDSPVLFLKIEISNAPVVSFGDPATLETGDNLFIVASLDGIFVSSFFRSFRLGEISAAAETVSRRLELNALIDSRFSGSAAANSSGEVVGFLITAQSDETKIVLPITAVEPAIYSLLKTGEIVSLWFGAMATDLSQAVGYDETYTRGYTKGALLGTIIKGSPAESAGLKRDDIIVSVDGVEISEKQSLGELLSDYRVGDTVALAVDRDGTMTKTDLILGAR